MKIAIRVDSSTEIGSGHLMRCLTLATALREKGPKVAFISRDLPGNLIGLVESKGFSVHRLPAPKRDDGFQPETHHAAWLGVPWQTDAEEVLELLEKLPRQDWMIVDSYAIDSRWEKLLRPLVDRIMVIDDLADRPHECDLLLDQNLYENMESGYDGLVPERCERLLGPKYALLRPEFQDARQMLRDRDGTVRRILIFFGGSDPTNVTAKALRAVQMLNRSDIVVDVVVGNANPNKEEIMQLCHELPACRYHCQVDNMAELVAAADLALGAGGATTWERCALGTPAMIFALADNQKAIAQNISEFGAASYLGTPKDMTAEELRLHLSRLIDNPGEIQRMSKKGLSLVDALGLRLVCASIMATG